MKTNILSLSFRQVAATDKSPAHLVGELRVDGSRLGEGYVLDVRRLADALTGEGEHFIFTYGCGEPGCAGIHEGGPFPDLRGRRHSGRRLAQEWGFLLRPFGRPGSQGRG